ncbi:UNVERIFIED_CONTAM: hypothetical protein HDU68_003649 [Siphonaria sp. JEL0065]|nr:hypothetical protein HDU68_003649 [Siphonaria sp. JEL0065]
MIVATPGRFLDVLQNDPVVNKRIRGLNVYDEADLLLVHGFQNNHGRTGGSHSHNPCKLSACDTEYLALLKETYRKGSWPVGSACYSAFDISRKQSNDKTIDQAPYMPLTSETLVKAADEFAMGLCGLPRVPKIGSGLQLGLYVEDVKVLTPKEEADLRGSILADPNTVQRRIMPFAPKRGFQASSGSGGGKKKEFKRK